MRTIGVIPARYESTRLKAKVLADIHGKPMLQHVWERARRSRLLDDLLIACDHELVFQTAKKFGAQAVLTSPDHRCGSDRIAEAVQNLEVDVVINIQGDEPLITPRVIDSLAGMMRDDPDCLMATVIKSLDSESELMDPNTVKVVIDQNQNALYFSRAPIPYGREKTGTTLVGHYKHLGIYAYRKDFLLTFVGLPQGSLEKAERLEQLRALEAGYKIKTVLTDIETMSVDTPADLRRVQEFLKQNAFQI